MTRKHFEALAWTIALVYGQLEDNTINKDRLLTALIDELSNFCGRQNARFNYNKFKDRVLEYVAQE